MELLRRGAKNRHIESTNMNLESSRSHSVFSISVETKIQESGVWKVRNSHFHFVDLAGSERQKQTETKGDRLKEGCNINRSLSVLGSVINSLVESSQGKKVHIRYRDSKLTFLLRDSLGGNSKTAMIANLSPATSAYHETLSTLQFAQRAKLIKNRAVLNEDTSGDTESLRREVKRLQDELETARGIIQGFGAGIKDENVMDIISRSVSSSLSISYKNAKDSKRLKELEQYLKEGIEVLRDTQLELQNEYTRKQYVLEGFSKIMLISEKREIHLRAITHLKDEQSRRKGDLFSLYSDIKVRNDHSNLGASGIVRELESITKLIVQERDHYKKLYDDSPLIWSTFKENILMHSRLSELEKTLSSSSNRPNVLPFIQRVLHHLTSSLNENQYNPSVAEQKVNKKKTSSESTKEEIERYKQIVIERDATIDVMKQHVHSIKSKSEQDRLEIQRLKNDISRFEEERKESLRNMEYVNKQMASNTSVVNQKTRENKLIKGDCSDSTIISEISEKEVLEYKRKVRILEGIISDINEQLDSRDLMIKDTEHHRDRLSSELYELQLEKSILINQLDIEKNRTKKLQEEKLSVEREMMILERQLEDQKQSNIILQGRVNQKEQEIIGLLEDNAKCNTDIERKDINIIDLKNRMKKHIEKINDIRYKYHTYVQDNNAHSLMYNTYHNMCTDIISSNQMYHDTVSHVYTNQHIDILNRHLDSIHREVSDVCRYTEDIYDRYQRDISVYVDDINMLKHQYNTLYDIAVNNNIHMFRYNNSISNRSTTNTDSHIGKRSNITTN